MTVAGERERDERGGSGEGGRREGRPVEAPAGDSPSGGTRGPATGAERPDPLMAALAGTPPVGQDATSAAEYEAAAADIALLARHVRSIGDALAQRMPDGAQRMPDGAQQSPDSPQRTPDGVQRAPDGSGRTAAHGGALLAPGDRARAGAGRAGSGRADAARSPEARPGRPSRTRTPRSPRRAATTRHLLRAAAALAAVSAIGGLVWLGAQSAGTGGSSADGDKGAADGKSLPGADAGGGRAAPAREQWIACSRVLAEGTVRTVTETEQAGGQVRVVLDVDRYYRPERSAKGHPTVTVTLGAPAAQELKPGMYAVVRTPARSSEPDEWARDGTARHLSEELRAAQAGAKGLDCTGPSGG
ncbi:hypothetical protein [Streptomyces tsukubensis]|uniref:Uncharacterized protein n=1 Tax=Streptomyces tsukubensis TaxID=83656 RepID=A0A1V4ABV4_9ACTN|nr:hypothetical protein [Streptomyces tsukubensis]OON80769.1 hypothetical protein B1H18_10205 [Streptomyces tsukubensis]QFR93590.1 hypothetical protein GBW32_11460 [Streptomyces tsukubensis]